MNNTQQYHTLDFTQYTDLVERALSEDLGGQIDLPVSYTHLTLPTNREV